MLLSPENWTAVAISCGTLILVAARETVLLIANFTKRRGNGSSGERNVEYWQKSINEIVENQNAKQQKWFDERLRTIDDCLDEILERRRRRR